jgi:uncharacterized protein (TIGR03437 family)
VVFPEVRIAVLYATGEGLLSPLPLDGEIMLDPLPRPALPVKVWLANREVPILYAGPAPGLVAGLLQINIQIPADLPDQSPLPVVLEVGSTRSPAGVSLIFPPANRGN